MLQVGLYSYGPLPVISTYNPIYRMYNPIYNQLQLINDHNCNPFNIHLL